MLTFDNDINIENIIKNTKYPLLMIYMILNNNNISDKYKFIVVKYFYKYHIMIGLENNLLMIDNIENTSPLTFNLISDIYYIVSKQLLIIPYILKFHKAYKNNKFWKLNIEDMILYLKKLHTSFLSLFDGSKGSFYFHVKIKGMKDGNDYHLEEIKDRLKKTYDMFKMNFFNEYNIILISYHQFIDLSFENMVKYVEYIFTKVNNIIVHNINYLMLYNNYRLQLYNLLYNISNIDIDIIDVNSDIEPDDLSFIVSNDMV
jgi:hypothetical protein